MFITTAREIVPFKEDIKKLIEEAPSPALDTELRKRMGDAAVLGAKSVNYEAPER